VRPGYPGGPRPRTGPVGVQYAGAAANEGEPFPTGSALVVGLRDVRGVATPAAAAPVTVDALPAVVNLLAYQGDDYFLNLFVTDPAGDPANLTGCTAKAEVRVTTADAAPLASFTATVAADQVSLHLPHVEAAKLTAGTLRWDCQLTDAAGVVTTIASGTVVVTAEVTR